MQLSAIVEKTADGALPERGRNCARQVAAYFRKLRQPARPDDGTSRRWRNPITGIRLTVLDLDPANIGLTKNGV